MPEKHACTPGNAAKFKEWLTTRGGIAVWESVNLSNPGASWSTPANQPDGTPTTKPTWQAGSEPSRVITDPSEVVVVVPRLVKKFHVGVRMGGMGMSLKLTDGATRRVRRECGKVEGSWYEFDYGSHDNCLIFAPDKEVPLDEFLASQAPVAEGVSP